MNHTVATEEEKRLTAYANSGSDSEAAALLSMSVFTFRGWRQARKLPAKGKPGKGIRQTPVTLEELRAKLPR